jgi:hypothetical protein
MAAMSKNDIATKVALNLPPKAMPGRGNTPAWRAKKRQKTLTPTP